jgi:hypothetical protein
VFGVSVESVDSIEDNVVACRNVYSRFVSENCCGMNVSTGKYSLADFIKNHVFELNT